MFSSGFSVDSYLKSDINVTKNDIFLCVLCLNLIVLCLLFKFFKNACNSCLISVYNMNISIYHLYIVSFVLIYS